ncbi:MAG TPA: lysylphosphatidylglycerol synthase transmembrane domain-containing protein [Bacteroidales bacterium]|nr:lysylphosphatidylglycerol synthase transmembrane domain-containing protein [Bacteroidales bacterium]
MKKSLLNILKFLAFLSLGIVLLYFAFKGIKFQQLVKAFQSVNYWWVLLSLVFAFIAYASRAYRWSLLIEPLGYSPTFSNSFYSLMIGYLANFAFPRIGEITRCGTLSRTEKIPVDSLIGTVIIERATDLLSLLTLLIILIVAKFNFFGSFFNKNIFNPFYEKVAATFNFSVVIWIFIFSSILLFILLYFIFRARLAKLLFVKKTKKAIKGILSGIKTVYTMKKRGQFLLHTVLIWVMYWLMTYVVVFAIPATSDLTMVDGLFLLVIGGLGMSAPVQGGIGAYHWIVSLGLTIYGIPRADGLAFATISHESQSLFAIALGTMSFLVLFFAKKKKTVTVV